MTRNRKLVVDELLTKPSAISPMLFVGLGGCGCKMVKRVAEHLRRRRDYEERYKSLVKFALVDTNVNDLESYREIADETFLISDFEKEEYADLASGKLFLEADPYFTQWVPQSYRFRAGDTAGAGQIRIESRLGVFYQMKHKDLVGRFRKLLEALKAHEHGHRRLDSPEIRIIICYSVAGGTGSGSHLPISYMLREQAKELGKPCMIGVAVLPAVFEDKTGINRDGTFANGYAALKETEHLMKLGAPDSRFFPEDGVEFHFNPFESSKKTVRERPFEFVYVIDKPESFTVRDPVIAAADGLYLQFFSPLYSHQASDYDNYTQHQRFLVPHDFEGKGIVGFTSFYGSYGAAVLLVPVDGLVEYCSRAAALSLMRSSFLRSIPGDPLYQLLRTNQEPFFEVTLGDEKNEKPVHVSEFHKKEQSVRDRLLDRLYMKRVCLLAHCEYAEGESKRYLALFRHGHRLGEIPRSGGTWEHRKEFEKEDHKQLVDRGMKYSIGAIVLPAIAGEPGEPAGLVKQARMAIDAYAQDNRASITGNTRAGDLAGRARDWMEEYRRRGISILRNGYKVGTIRYPGMDSLVELSFLRDEAGEVDLAAKRYAVLSILERVDWEIGHPEPVGDFDLGPLKDSDVVREKDASALVDSLEQQAIDKAMESVRRMFIESLGDLKENLTEFAKIHRVLERGFDNLEREQSRSLEKLRDQGDSSANQYELDAEALQIEDGRRLWDFFYEDRVAQLRELSLGDRQVQRLLSDTVTEMSVSGRSTTTATLDKLFTELRNHAHHFLHFYIGGDPHSPDRERRDGITLSDALELEVVYRALYRSNTEAVESEKHKAIRDLVAQYRHQPPEKQINLGDPRHQDYLRDKIKRVVKEKASVLCVYDDSRDQHGGVRPDHVFIAAIDEDFKSSTIEEVIQSADPGLHWVTTGWHNPKEIIFYRAVLNVPLYVFGRMNDMRDYYYEFRNLARRPKVLHIDKNWENALPDLDPQSAQEEHRQNLLRDHVINFAALMTVKLSDQGRSSCIVRRNGHYCLLDPDVGEPKGAKGDARSEGDGPSAVILGPNLSQAIERLPEAMAAERVKYMAYQQMLRGIREGLAPEVLRSIAKLPFRWRQNRDQLRTQYGSNPSPEQQLKLKDYSDAYQRLQEALNNLLEKMRNRLAEQQALGEDGSLQVVDVSPREAEECLTQSLRILANFSEAWDAMEDPDQKPGAVPKTFGKLFRPLNEKDLNSTLESLREMPMGG